MDAIVIAGGVPQPEEPLYPFTQGMPKAMLDICGKPMVQWVLDALCGAERVERVVLIGLPEDSELVVCDKIAAFIPSRGGMLDNIRGGVEKILGLNPDAGHVLVTSSDIPGVTPEIVNWLVDTTMQTDEDVYYSMVTRQVMEARFPDSMRSFVRLKGMEVCGGDMNVARTSLVMEDNELWDKIVAARKSVFKQAALIGYDTLVLLLLRLVTLEGAVKKVTKRLGLSGRAIVSPYAEVAMDVDKPHQLEIMRADLAGRASGEREQA